MPKFGKRGSVMVLFTLMLPTLLLPLVGLAIDASICRLVQTKLQAAVDGAAIGTGRLLSTSADPETIAREFVDANFRTDNSAGSWGANNLNKTDIHFYNGISKRIDINVSADVPLLFMRILGKTKATVSAGSSATRSDSRVVFVIDRSGSMNTSDGAGSTVLADAKNYAAQFVQRFTSGADELGLVTFDGTGVVAYPLSNPNWDSNIAWNAAGGPDSSFDDPADPNNMVAQIGRIGANNGQTNTSEAIWLAYMELQKAHLKDLHTDGVDYRLNSIVLLTDGLPQAVSVFPNDTSNGGANNVMKATSPCTYRNTAANPIKGWISVTRNGSSFSGMPPQGPYSIGSTDTTASRTSVWWMGANSAPFGSTPTGGGGYEGHPVPNTNNCSGFNAPLDGQSTSPLRNAATNDFGTIPATDLYGNSMRCNAYSSVSQFVDANGNTVTNPLQTGLTITPTSVTVGDQWELCFWCAVDDAANRVRNDVNLSNRTGDIQNMGVTIFVIGYSGNGGVDQGLLKRVANDKNAIGYNLNQKQGLYVPAGNPTALQNAFNTVYQAILRLSK